MTDMQRLGDMIARKLRMMDARLNVCQAASQAQPLTVEVAWEGYVTALPDVTALWTGMVTQLDNSPKGTWRGFVTIV